MKKDVPYGKPDYVNRSLTASMLVKLNIGGMVLSFHMSNFMVRLELTRIVMSYSRVSMNREKSVTYGDL